MQRKIIQIGDERLTQKSSPVKDILSRESQQLADDLIDTLVSHEGGAVGLSAVQIGVLQRMFAFDKNANRRAEPAEYEVVINPEIEYLGEAKDVQWEGCMSIGTGRKRIYGPVERPKRIKLTYFNRKGEKVSEEYSRFIARVIQHEYDHLDGILFTGLVENVQNLWTSEMLDKYLDNHDHYPPIV